MREKINDMYMCNSFKCYLVYIKVFLLFFMYNWFYGI